MKRVRIVAFGAAALGVAVVAGSQFQSLQGGMPPAPGAEQPIAMAGQSVDADRLSLVQAGALPAPDQGQPLLPPGVLAAETGVPMPMPGAQPTAMGGQNDLQLADLNLNPVAPLQPMGNAPLSGAAVLTPPSGIPPVDLGAQPVPRILEGLARADESAPSFAPVQSTMAQAAVETVPLDSTLEAELNACAVWLVVTPAPGAMLDASIYAPCDRSAQVQVSHAGLTFDAQLGDDGQLLTQIPALSVEGLVEMRFADGRVASDQTPVTDLADIDRIALQWNAPISVALHAYEFGAQYGDPGHIHAGNPQVPGAQGRGFLTLLGDVNRMGSQVAQVYSYPRGQSPLTGQVSLEIEVPVTQLSCGQVLQAHAFELFGGNSGQVRAINLEMPDCENASGYVVLPGVLSDLQIALN